MTWPRIGLAAGDPGGVGPEVVVKTLARPDRLPPAAYILFADPAAIAVEEQRLGLRLGLRPWPPAAPREEAGLFLQPIAGSGPADVGLVTAANGQASFRAFETAVAEARAGRLEAIVTAPVAKAAWALAGLPYRGHTEYLATLYPDAVMTFWSERLRIALFSHHRPLKEAVAAVRREALLEFFRSLHRGLGRVPGGPYRLLAAGLNPHAGEDGGLGREEIEEIGPAIQEAAAEGIPVSGPFPPDVVFRKALGQRDAVVAALYHDQGLIAFKLEAFATGVNATLGLPFVRTSPDHGTAFDIAGRGLADPRSMEEAVRLAAAFSATGS